MSDVDGFLRKTDWAKAQRVDLAGDASTRRYQRLSHPSGGSAILMIAPTVLEADRQSLRRFLTVAATLHGQHLSAPEILATDIEAGLILMEDFGDLSVSRLLEIDTFRAEVAYAEAARVLDKLAAMPLPAWAARPDIWGLVDMVDVTFDHLPNSVDLRARLRPALAAALRAYADGPPVLSLRDYHADNLMWLPDRDGLARVGLLDFQDAVALPHGYDLASLVDDVRRVVPDDWRHTLIADMAAQRGWTSEATLARIDTLSLLRNLRILGIFRKLSTMDGKPGYRRYMPRTLALIARAVANPSLADLQEPVDSLLDACAAWADEAPA